MHGTNMAIRRPDASLFGSPTAGFASYRIDAFEHAAVSLS